MVPPWPRHWQGDVTKEVIAVSQPQPIRFHSSELKGVLGPLLGCVVALRPVPLPNALPDGVACLQCCLTQTHSSEVHMASINTEG